MHSNNSPLRHNCIAFRILSCSDWETMFVSRAKESLPQYYNERRWIVLAKPLPFNSPFTFEFSIYLRTKL